MSAITGEDRRHGHEVRVAVPHVRDLVAEHGLELRFGMTRSSPVVTPT